MFKMEMEVEYPSFDDSSMQPAVSANALEAAATEFAAPAPAPEVGVPGMGPSFSVGAEALGALGGVSWELIRGVVGKVVWDWYDDHSTDTVVKFKVKIIWFPLRVTVRVKDCGWLIRALFGDRPSGTVTNAGGGTVTNSGPVVFN